MDHVAEGVVGLAGVDVVDVTGRERGQMTTLLASPGAAPLNGVPAVLAALELLLVLDPEPLPQAATPSARPTAITAGRRRRVCT